MVSAHSGSSGHHTQNGHGGGHRGGGGAISRNILPSSIHERVAKKRGSSDSYMYNSNINTNSSSSSTIHQQPHLSRKKSRVMMESMLSSQKAKPSPSQAGKRAGSALGVGALAATPGNSGYTRGMYLAFVDNALAKKRMGNNEHYNELVGQFRAISGSATAFSSTYPPSSSTATTTPSNKEQPTQQTLKLWMEALIHVVAQLDRSHSVLIDSIISLPWTTMDESLVNTYTRFVQALLTSRSEFVAMTLEKIVKGFRFQTSNIYTDSASSSPTANTFTRRQTYARLHALLSSLIYLIPTLPNILWPILNKFLPYKRENRNAHVVYFTNALKIVEYCPQLGENVLGAIMLRAIQIDVEIQIDIEDLEDDEGMLDEEVFGFSTENPFNRYVGDEDSDSDSDDDEGEEALQLDDVSSGDESSDEDEDESASVNDEERILSPKVVKRLKEMAAKLDAILKVLFDFLQRINNASTASAAHLVTSSTPSTIDQLSVTAAEQNADDLTYLSQTSHILKQAVFEVLLNIFDEKILKTFKTKHIQFILFWYSSISFKFTNHFMGHLIGIVLSDSQDSMYGQDPQGSYNGVPLVIKISAASYIASFVARAKSIEKKYAREVVKLLLIYLEDRMEELRYIQQKQSSSQGLNGAPSAAVIAESERFIKNSVVFYAVAQACFYIFCFRWRDLLDESGDDDDIEGDLEGVPSAPVRRWMPELDILKQAICSGFNPLKMCSPTVVAQFARMAHKTDFMYCHSIIEANKRMSRSRRNTLSLHGNDSTSTLSTPTQEIAPSLHGNVRHSSLPRTSSQPSVLENGAVEATLREGQLDSHFPFDPYKLPLSASFVQGIYRNWDSGGLYDDDDESDDGNSDDDGSSTASEEEEGGSSRMESDSFQGSSVDSDDIKAFLAVPSAFHATNNNPNNASNGAASASIDIKGGSMNRHQAMHEGDVSGSSVEDPFSQSFEAMSVSPHRPSGLGR